MRRVLRALKHLPIASSILLFASVALLLMIAIPDIFPPRNSRVAKNQFNAVNTIRAIILDEETYSVQNPDNGFACSFSDFSKQNARASGGLHFSYLLFDGGTLNGYHFEIRCPQDGSGRATRYTITAVPTKAGDSGKLAFCADQSGEIRYSESGSASECIANGKHVQLE